MKAKNREQYIAAWTSHVKELIHVFMDAGLPIEPWYETRERLMGIIDDAATATYGPAEQVDLVCGACTVGIGGHTMQQGCGEFEGDQS